jgi:hypothetical protein
MTRKFSSEVLQLADQYALGTPVKRHSHLGWIIFFIYVLGMMLLITVAFPFSVFSSDTGSNPSIASGSCMELTFLFGAIISIVLIRVYLPYSAYECTNGFIELNRRKGKIEVRQFLLWDDVSSVHMRNGHYTSYYVIDRKGRKMSVDSRAIWRKCKRVAAQHTATGR